MARPYRAIKLTSPNLDKSRACRRSYWRRLWPYKDGNGSVPDRGLKCLYAARRAVASPRVKLSIHIHTRSWKSAPSIEQPLEISPFGFLPLRRNFVNTIPTLFQVQSGPPVIKEDTESMPKYAKKRGLEDEDSGQEQAVKPSKKSRGSSSTPGTAGTKGKDAEGNPFWEVRGNSI